MNLQNRKLEFAINIEYRYATPNKEYFAIEDTNENFIKL